MRLRRRGPAGCCSGAVVLFLIGTNVQAGMLFVLAALLLGALVAGVVAAVAALRGLAATIERARPRPNQGEAASSICGSPTRARGVRWSVARGRTSTSSRRRCSCPRVRPGGDGRGRRRCGSPRARGDAGDHVGRGPLGGAVRRGRTPPPPPRGRDDARAAARLPARPAAVRRAGAPPTTSAIRSAPRRGHGPDFLGVREYRPGDAMRHVHWGLDRTPRPVMVREFEEERTRRLAIVVDTERDAGEAWTPLDRACAVAASVLERGARARGTAPAWRPPSTGGPRCSAANAGTRCIGGSPRLGSDRHASGRRAAGAPRRRAPRRGHAARAFPVWPGTDLGGRRRRGRRDRPARGRSCPCSAPRHSAVSEPLGRGRDPAVARRVRTWRSRSPPRGPSADRRCSKPTVRPRTRSRCGSSSALAVELGIVAVVIQGAVDALGGGRRPRARAARVPVLLPAAARRRARGEGRAHGRARSSRSRRSSGRSAASGRSTRRASRSPRCSCGSRSSTRSTCRGGATSRSRWCRRRPSSRPAARSRSPRRTSGSSSRGRARRPRGSGSPRRRGPTRSPRPIRVRWAARGRPRPPARRRGRRCRGRARGAPRRLARVPRDAAAAGALVRTPPFSLGGNDPRPLRRGRRRAP